MWLPSEASGRGLAFFMQERDVSVFGGFFGFVQVKSRMISDVQWNGEWRMFRALTLRSGKMEWYPH